MSEFSAFADDVTALTIGGLTIENGLSHVSVSGSLDVGLDKSGLAHITALKAAIDCIYNVLATRTAADDEAQQFGDRQITMRRNPFA